MTFLDMVKGNKFVEKQDNGGYTYLTTSADEDLSRYNNSCLS